MNASISANPPPGKTPDAGGLRIAGLTPYSSIDYPGCLSAVVWVQGCPWRCGYCHNPHLQLRTTPPQMRWDEVMVFLRKRVGLLDAVVFSGGEATTDRHLGAAMAEAKALGYKIGLHTAGCYPERLQHVLPLVDWVGLDVKTLWENYDALTGVPGSAAAAQAALDLLLTSAKPHEIRTTVHPAWMSAGDLETLGRRIAAAGGHRYVLQPFRNNGSLNPALRSVDLRAFPGNETLLYLRSLFFEFVAADERSV